VKPKQTVLLKMLDWRKMTERVEITKEYFDVLRVKRDHLLESSDSSNQG
jgi:hypothetical protein